MRRRGPAGVKSHGEFASRPRRQGCYLPRDYNEKYAERLKARIFTDQAANERRRPEIQAAVRDCLVCTSEAMTFSFVSQTGGRCYEISRPTAIALCVKNEFLSLL